MTSTPEPITLNIPSKYASSSSNSSLHPAPSLDWLIATWTVTHSTLPMWRKARNVRITYKPLPAHSSSGRPRLDDLVEYEPRGSSGVRKTVAGIDTQSSQGGQAQGKGDGNSWDWRGRGLLAFVSSHWEVLAWGEAARAADGETERWAVTWFAPTLFSAEGLDVYCDRKEGLSDETYQRVREALGRLGAEGVVSLVEKDMRPVEIQLPWCEG